jgi:hypothetical protein
MRQSSGGQGDEEVEVIVPLPQPRERIAFPKQIRSTLLVSSLRSIRARNLFDAYYAGLDPPWRKPILESVAGSWLPLEAGMAHYSSCDALGLSVVEQVAIGREVGDRIQGTFLGTMIRAAKVSGATPWTVFPYTMKLYERLFDGGACWVVKAGPKDARLEIVANPIVSITYFRNAMRGVWQAALELFCQKTYVAEIGRTPTSDKVKVSWA